MYTQGAPIKVGNISLANVTSAPAVAGPPPPVHGQVQCSLHKKTRAIKFVQQKPIFNAEGTIVGYTYHCSESSPCIVGGQPAAEKPLQKTATATEQDKGDDGSDFDIDGPSQSSSNDGRPPSGLMKKLGYDGVRTSTTGSSGPTPASGGLLAATGGAIPKGLFGDASDAPAAAPATAARFSVGGGNTAGRAPSRYYDMAKNGRDDDHKKVCWSCGMDSHEKPACPNLLCRNCHDAQEPGYEGRMNHRCTRVGLSAFVLLDTDFLDNFMAAEELQRHNNKMREKAASEGSTTSSRGAAVADGSSSTKSVLTFDEAAFVNPSLLTTRCPRCNQLGHMDCPHPLSAHVIKRDAANNNNNNNNKKGQSNKKKDEEAEGIQRQLSCCGCASSDHSGYECPSRPRDYWRERVLNAAADQLGIDEVRSLVAIDERVPLPSKAGGGGGGNSSYNNYNNNYNNNNNNSTYGGASSSSAGGGRPFGMGSSYSNNTNNNKMSGGRRRRDESDGEDWSDEDRSPRRAHRGEYDRSYNRAPNKNSNNNSNSNKGGRGGRRFSDEESDYSYSDDDGYDSFSDGGRRGGGRKGGRNGGGGGGGGGGKYGGRSHHQGHQGRLDHRDHGRNTPSGMGYGAPRGGGSSSYQQPQQYQRPSSNNNNNNSYYAPPPQSGSVYRAPQSTYSLINSSPSYGRPNTGGSYSAPYGGGGSGGGQQQQQYGFVNPKQQQNNNNNNNNNQSRYSRPPQPPANSQPGRGQYNKRGFEF